MLALGLVLALTAPVQQRPEVDLPRGSGSPVIVASPREFWIGARHGHLFASRDAGGSWREVEVGVSRGETESGMGGSDLGGVRFFDSRAGILPARMNGNVTKLLRTQDGGRTWQTVALPGDMWIYDACVLPQGLAWLVGHTGQIYFSRDFGKSWETRPSPLDQVLRPRCVYFSSPTRGLLGGNRNTLHVTEDGCRTWRQLATPADQDATPNERAAQNGSTLIENPDGSYGSADLPPGPSTPIAKARFFGDRIVLSQDRKVSTRSLESDEPWRPVRLGGAAVVDFELHPRGLAVLAENGIVALLDESLEPVWSTQRPLESMPIPDLAGGMSVAGDRVLVFDGYTLLHEIAGGRLRSTRLLMAEDAAVWHIVSLDRAADGTMWGTGRRFLYTSRDGARTWARVALLPAETFEVFVQDSGDVFLLGFGEAHRWRASTRAMEPVPAFERLSIVDVFRRGPLWLAYGARYTDEETLWKETGSLHSVFAGDFATGVVLASTDGGETWRTVDEWEGGRVEALFLTPVDRLATYRIAAGIRSGELHWKPGGEARADLHPADAPDIEIQYGPRFVFYGEKRGVLTGGRFYGGSPVYTTRNGGRTWREDARETVVADELYRLGGGSLIARVGTGPSLAFAELGVEGEEPPPDFLTILDGDDFVDFKEFGRSFRWVRTDPPDACSSSWTTASSGASPRTRASGARSGTRRSPGYRREPPRQSGSSAFAQLAALPSPKSRTSASTAPAAASRARTARPPCAKYVRRRSGSVADGRAGSKTGTASALPSGQVAASARKAIA